MNVFYVYSVSGKKRPQCFLIISSIKLGRFWRNLLHSFLKKFATKSCKCFPPHLTNVSTLPGETWNANRARSTIELLRAINSRIYSTLTVPSTFARLESSWLQSVENIAREGVQSTHHWSGRTETATENGVGQAESCRRCGSHSSVMSSIVLDQWCVFCTPSLAIFLTCCNQLNSDLANMEATVEVR